MARYWVPGGTGNWNSTTNWSTTDGGTSGASVPDATQDANFTASSGAGTATVNASAACLNLNFTGFTGTFTGSSALAITGGLTLVVTMTLSYTGAITFNDTSGSTNSITSAGQTFLSTITFNGAGGMWQLADTFVSTAAGGVVLTTGTFDFNSVAATMVKFDSSGAGTRTAKLGNSQITITGNSTGGSWNTVSSLTLTTGGSSKISFNATTGNNQMNCGALVFDDVEFTTGGHTFTISGTGSPTFRNCFVKSPTAGGQFNPGGSSFTNLDFTGFVGIWGGASPVNVSGNLTMVGTMTTTFTGGLTFNGTGAQTLTSAGVQLATLVSINKASGTLTLADAFITTSGVNLTAGGLSSAGVTAQMLSFVSNTSNVRSLDLTNATWTVVGSGTVWNMSPFTNGSITVTSSLLIFDNSADSNNRLVATQAGVAVGDVHFTGTGSGNFDATNFGARDVSVSVTGGGSFKGCVQSRNLDFTGFTGSWTGTGTVNISGSLTMVTGMSIAGAMTSPLKFNDTTGTTRTITSAGKVLISTVTFDGVGGVWQLADAFTSTSTITLTNGSFSTLGYAVQCTTLSSSNTNTRVLDITNSTITLVPTTVTTAWQLSTTTGLAFTSTGSRIVFRGSSTGNISFATGSLTYNDVEYSGTSTDQWVWTGSPTFRDIFVTNHSGGWLGNAVWVCRNLNFTGFTGTWSGTGGGSISGDLTMSASMTNTNSGALVMNGTGTQTITSNGIGFNKTINISCTGTVQLADTFTATTLSTVTLLLVSGTFNTNNQAMFVTGVALGFTGATTRAFNLGSSVVTLTGGGTTIWNCALSPGTMAFNAGTSTIVLNTTSSSQTNFDGGGFTYYNVTFGTGAGTGAFEIISSNTFNNIELDGAPRTLLIQQTTTQTLNDLICMGTSSNLNTIKSAIGGVPATLSKAKNNTVNIDWTHFQDIHFTGGARWFLGQHAVNDGGTNGGRYAGSSDRYSSGDTPYAA